MRNPANKQTNKQTNRHTKVIAISRFSRDKNLIVQHLPVKEREKKIEMSRMRNGYIIDTLTSVDIQEMLKSEVK